MNYTWITPKDAGYIPGRSYIYSELVRAFPQTTIEEIDPELDCSADVDYIGKVGEKAFGIQVKIITANTADNSWMSGRMRNSLQEFEEDFGGKVFIIFSVDDHIKNVDILDDIQSEINRLNSL